MYLLNTQLYVNNLPTDQCEEGIQLAHTKASLPFVAVKIKILLFSIRWNQYNPVAWFPSLPAVNQYTRT